MKILISVILLFTVTVGCAQRKPFTIMDAKNQCATYGFKQDTSEMANCTMNVMDRKKIDNQRRAKIMGDAFRDAGNSFKPKLRCRTRPDYMGGSTTTCR